MKPALCSILVSLLLNRAFGSFVPPTGRHQRSFIANHHPIRTIVKAEKSAEESTSLSSKGGGGGDSNELATEKQDLFFFDNEEDDPAVSTGQLHAVEEKHSVSSTATTEPDDASKVLIEVLGVAGSIAIEILKGLRWGAANVLTASLPTEERLELLQRIGPSLDYYKDATTTTTRTQGSSIGENIAAAAAAESRRLKQWETEKKQIMKQAEEAANERVAAELAIQRQRMEQERRRTKEEAEKEKQKVKEELQKALEARAKIEAEAKEEELLAMEKTLRARELESRNAREEINRLAAEVTAAKEEQKTKDAEVQALREDQKEKEAYLQALKAKQQARDAELESIKKKQQAEEAELKATIEELKAKEAEQKAAGKRDTDVHRPSVNGVELRRYTAKEYRVLSDAEKAKLKELREQHPDRIDDKTVSETGADVHPLLGPVIADLGYKRIHLVSTGRLGTVPIWEKQRIYRNSRAKSMAKDKVKTMNLGFPGVICLHEDRDGKLSIIDGQHRIGMFMLLRDKMRNEQINATIPGDPGSNAGLFDRILVEVYPQKEDDSESHAQDLFLEINKSEPIKLLDMPGVAKAKDRNVITDAIEKLQDMYPKMFSPSQRCRAPNVNVDNLRDSVFAADVMKRHNLTTSKKLLKWVLEQNDLMGKRYQESEDARNLVTPKVWKKAHDNKFYLGLENVWLYN